MLRRDPRPEESPRVWLNVCETVSSLARRGWAERMDWNVPGDVAAFLRAGGLAAAARDRGMSAAALRRALAATAVGEALAVRENVAASEADRALLLSLADRLEALAASASQKVNVAKPRYRVRVSAGEVMVTGMLTPLMEPFVRSRPDILPVLIADHRPADLLRGDADVAIRMFPPAERVLVTRAVGRLSVGLYAHRKLLAGRDVASLDDLRDLPFVGPATETPVRRQLRLAGHDLARHEPKVICPSLQTELDAIRGGVGIGAAFCVVAGTDESLVRVLPTVSASFPMHVVMHEDQRSSEPVRAVFEAVAEVLRGPLAAVERSVAAAEGPL